MVGVRVTYASGAKDGEEVFVDNPTLENIIQALAQKTDISIEESSNRFSDYTLTEINGVWTFHPNAVFGSL
jgi:hypothetical protein